MSKFTPIPNESKRMNLLTRIDYEKRLRLLATSIFKWDGLPETVSERYLEQVLFETGKALFFEDKAKGGFMALQCTVSGELNVYREPIRYNAFSIGYAKQYALADCVLIRNNWDSEPTEPTIRMFANRLSNVERTIDVNVNNQKFPFVIVCDEKQRLTYRNVYQQIADNEPLILANNGLNPDAIKVLKTDAPLVADRLMDYKHEIWNEALSFLGLNNANTDKRERLITDEVEANNQMIEQSAMIMLMTRMDACKQINKKYGLNISVGLRQQPPEQSEPALTPEDEKGGAEDE